MLETLQTQIYKKTHTAAEVKEQKNKSEVEALKEQMTKTKEVGSSQPILTRQLVLMYTKEETCPCLQINLELTESQK